MCIRDRIRARLLSVVPSHIKAAVMATIGPREPAANRVGTEIAAVKMAVPIQKRLRREKAIKAAAITPVAARWPSEIGFRAAKDAREKVSIVTFPV